MGLGEVRQFLNLPGGDFRQPFGIKSLHHPSARHRGLKDLEGGISEGFGEVGQLQPVTAIGLVGAVTVHGVGESDPGERRLHLHAPHLLPNAFDQPFDNRIDVLPGDERHFQVDLGELRLPVGPQILIPETAGNLEVLLRPRHHQELFKLLGRLRQRIELPGIQPRGHQILPGTFRCAFEENRGFNFQESLLIQIPPDR